jgi:cytochrome b6-f complex iron-sulfur subunit
MERRKFLTWVGVGVLATNLPVVIAACSSPSESENTTQTTNPIPEGEYIAIGTSEQLAQDGYLLDETNNVIIVKKSDDTLSALNSQCTHRGCTVNWNQTDNNIGCNCHGSVFATDGQVVNGPADQPLILYEVKEENGSILVKI